MVDCAGQFSSPPKVCTNCVEKYIAMKQMEYDLHHLVGGLLHASLLFFFLFFFILVVLLRDDCVVKFFYLYICRKFSRS